MQKKRLSAWQTIQITGITAENYLFAWQTLQITKMNAENCFLAWHSLKKPEWLQKTAYISDKLYK